MAKSGQGSSNTRGTLDTRTLYPRSLPWAEAFYTTRCYSRRGLRLSLESHIVDYLRYQYRESVFSFE
jgi:hypothetical protein